MIPDRITDHADLAVDRLLAQYKDDELMVARIRAFGAQAQEIEDALWQILDLSNLDAATGAVLDRFGVLLYQERGAMTDEEYRARLRLRIIQLQSQGTAEELIYIFKTLMRCDVVQMVEFYPADFVLLTAIGADPVLDTAEILDAIQKAKPAGVGNVIAIETGNPFVFAGDPTGSGFGDATDPDVGGEFATIMI